MNSVQFLAEFCYKFDKEHHFREINDFGEIFWHKLANSYEGRPSNVLQDHFSNSSNSGVKFVGGGGGG